MGKTNKLESFKKLAEKICSDSFENKRKIIHISCAILALVSVILTIFAPLCCVFINNDEHNLMAAGVFNSVNFNEVTKIILTCAFIVILIFICLNMWFLTDAMFVLNNERTFSKKIRKTVLTDAAFVVSFTLATYIISPINNMLGGESKSNVSFVSLIIVSIVTVFHSAFLGIVQNYDQSKEKNGYEIALDESVIKLRHKLRFTKLELLVYTLISSIIALISLLSNIITVEFESQYISVNKISLSGIDLLKNVSTFDDMGRQLLAYLIFVALTTISVLAFLELVSFLGGSNLFGRISLVSICVSVTVSLVVGLFSKYYQIVQDINKGIIIDMIKDAIGNDVQLDEALKWNVSSASLYYFVALLVVVAIVFIRRPYTKVMIVEQQFEKERNSKIPQAMEIVNTVKTEDNNGTHSAEAYQSNNFEAFENTWNRVFIDPCPAFTALDKKGEEYRKDLDVKKESLIENPTLPKLVDFIVQYARDSRLHLFYTPENIATFLAGLGATKLTILQGMSGTGKTSLPKIVAEALMSVCDIVEVESSWRDKNELLGYYNEFSQTYTPKKFTQALYKAALNPDVLTFIVLDEMNLSRIEYYFSDFLSIMENEPDKREIKLLNVPLYRKEQNRETKYSGLADGFTLKIPNNVWFIGTANRDESTFDISDKVYDRAHTMNFDKRAASVRTYNNPSKPKYLPAPILQKMFEEAKSSVNFNLESSSVIAEVEKLLAPYNISFGNRIAIQIENFVKIYASCFAVSDTVIRDALETILLSKVVRKLELKTIDDPEGLSEAFAKLHLMRCSEFINNLKET